MYKLIATLGTPLAAAAILVAPTTSVPRAFAANLQPAAAQQAAPLKRAAARERHPEIRKAIDALERAKTDLKRANHDFGGHREAALDACDKAIVQLRLALQYDKK
jgi:hypothetical protein